MAASRARCCAAAPKAMMQVNAHDAMTASRPAKETPGARDQPAALTMPLKSAAFSEAPPTSPPSTFDTAKISAAFDALTLPP